MAKDARQSTPCCWSHAHLLETAKKLDKKTNNGYISNQFHGPDASALHDLLDYIADKFSSDATPLWRDR